MRMRTRLKELLLRQVGTGTLQTAWELAALVDRPPCLVETATKSKLFIINIIISSSNSHST